MKKILLTIIFSSLLFVFISIIWGINTYNNLVILDENIKKQWGQVENVYQRRSDLIPNLVNTVKGSATFERKTLNQIIESRSKVNSIQLNPQNLNQTQIDKFQKAQEKLSHSIGRLLLIVENYPDLKSQENFYELQNQLEGTENRISVERNRYNEQVNHFNSYRNQFPQIIISNFFTKLKEKGYFRSENGSKKSPRIDFYPLFLYHYSD